MLTNGRLLILYSFTIFDHIQITIFKMKRLIFFASVLLMPVLLKAQTIDSVDIPKNVVYKYTDPATILKANNLLLKELSDSATYNLNNGLTIVGPQLWYRYSQIPELNNIPNGNVSIRFNNKAYPAKMLQDADGFKKVWKQLINDIGNEKFIIRKATNKELVYYWAVISFDIDEPLLILENATHRYLFNFSPKDLKLLWIDEVPSSMK
jgi:hypothetical protein